MEQIYKSKMQAIGYDQNVCDIFVNWEDVKDELLIPERKKGSGNGTIHVFWGQLMKNFVESSLCIMHLCKRNRCHEWSY